MKQQKSIKLCTIFTLLTSLSTAIARSSSLRSNTAITIHNTTEIAPQISKSRTLKSTIQGTCKSSSLSSGDLIKANEILCYPMPSDDTTIYKLGVDSSNNLAYYVYDTLVWSAVPVSQEESTACTDFGNCDGPSMVYFRLQNGGSLVGYDIDTVKIWDSHENVEGNGEYSTTGVFGGDGSEDAVSDKVSGSTLSMNEEGVFIKSTSEEVTWRIFAPNWDAPTKSPVKSPTAEPTNKPTRVPTTENPTMNIGSNSVGVSGRVFVNGTESSSIVESIVVDLYSCPESGDPIWIVMTRSNETGHYVLKNDDASDGENDLSALLESMAITKFRAVFGGLPTGFVFSPAVSGSDVNSDGMTTCWDLEVNGRGSIVWDAGVISVPELTTARPTTRTPTSKPSSSDATNEPTLSMGLIGGYAFFDADNNGMRYPDTTVEPSMTNIDVELFSCGSTASHFKDDYLLAVAETNAEGLYIFRNLTSGYYRVNVISPDEYVFSSVWSGNLENGQLTDPNADSTVDPDTGSTPCFQFIRGNTELSWSLGLRYDDNSSSTIETPAPSSIKITEEDANSTIVISGMVFFDKNNDGYFEEIDEKAISNVDAALFDCNGSIILVSTTDENGMYGFDNLQQGPYQIKVSPPNGYEFSNTWSGSVSTVDSDVDPNTGLSLCQTFSDSVYSLDAGLFLSGDITPTNEPTTDPKGDGTACSGVKCPEEGMCRNVAGVCGTGLSFCNPESVWIPGCAEEESKSPTLAPVTVTPTISVQPTTSRVPSLVPTVFTKSVCNNDGTYGETTSNSDKGLKEQGVSFTYSLLNESGESFDAALMQFEKDLNLRLACVYFESSCLNCSTHLRQGLTRSRRLMVEGSDLVGISFKPNDEQNLAEACAFPNYNCRVITGLMTSYFPSDTPLSKVIGDINQLLGVISNEMATGHWNGLSVSYNNEAIVSGVKDIENGSNNNGSPTGVIVAVTLAAVAACAAIAALVVLFVRDRREKAEKQVQQRAILYGNDSHGSQSFQNEDDSDSDSSSSEDNMSGVISGPSLVSGGDFSFPTTMAHANLSDVEQDDSSSSSDSSSGRDVDDMSGQHENEVGALQSIVDSFQILPNSDKNPPIYEQDDNTDYSQDRGYYPQTQEQVANDRSSFDVDEQYHQYPMSYGQTINGDNDSNGSGKSMESMNSADPPGRSFQELHQREDDYNLLPPQSTVTNNNIEDGFYVGEAPDVYEYDEVSNPESYYSSNSNRSHRSNRSNRSHSHEQSKSRKRSESRERSRSRTRNQVSYHSVYNENEYIGEVEQVSMRHDHGGDYMEHNPQIPEDNSFDHDQHYNRQQHDNGVIPRQYDQNELQPQRYSQYQDMTIDHGDDTTVYSDVTRQVSNVRVVSGMQKVEQSSEANLDPNYEDDEESISQIFKSLSEIQTKLAKKGKTS